MKSEKYTAHLVSTKAVLYSGDAEKVLVMKYASGYGLPGGHLEPGETPDEAIAREFKEELGAELPLVRRADFFLHEAGGTVILAFVGLTPADVELKPTRPEYEIGEWVTSEQLKTLDIAPSYTTLIRDNWPN